MHTYTASGDTSDADVTDADKLARLSSFDLIWSESNLYGSNRLGLLHQNAPAEVNWGGALHYGSRGAKFYEISNHLGNVLAVISDKKMGHTSNGTTLDYYEPDVVSVTDYYPFGMVSRSEYLGNLSLGYRYGFNGKENDGDVKGDGNQIDYGLRIYDPRLGRFLSEDPLTGKFSFYSPYQYAGNSPIKFIDLDGAETYDNSSQFWAYQPLINMSSAPAKGVNAAGIPRNAIWFFKQQLAAKPEMFSEANKLNIANKINPIVDEQWVKYNSAAGDYMGQRLIHHHIEGGEIAAAIPERMHYDNFSELHPYVKAAKNPKGTKFSGLVGGTLNALGNISMFTGLFTGDPDSWVNFSNYGDPQVGQIKKDFANTGLYVQIMSVVDHYTNETDSNGKTVIDPNTGKAKQRLESKTVTADIYSGYIWDEDKKKFEGVNKVSTKTENWQYNKSGTRTSATDVPTMD